MSIAEILDTMSYGPAPESDKEARAWIKTLGGETKLFIGGAWKKAKTGESFETTAPGSGEVMARIAQAGAADVDAAVKAAAKAQPAWAALPGHQRARYLYALARLIQRHSRLFAVVETLDNGKPIRETRDIDIPLVARHFYHHAGWAQLMDGELADREALGVCGQIIPWNFPLLMLAWKIAPAIALGNTVVLKPAEYTSLTALLFAEMCQKAGLPEGVVNIITGDGATGEEIVKHPGIAKIAFTGSTEVGRRIREATAGTGKSLTLELGGKSPFIVFDDADLDAAVEGVVDAIWFNQGQVCCAGSRLLVQESIHDRFIAKLKARMETLRVGDPLDKVIDIGAIVHPGAAGAHPLAGRGGRQGRRHPAPAEGRRSGQGLLLSADAADGRTSGLDGLARRDLRPRARRNDVPHARRGGGTCEQHGIRPRRLRLERDPVARARHRAKTEMRRGLGERHQHVRCRRRFWRLQGIRLRPRGWPRRAFRLQPAEMARQGQVDRREAGGTGDR